MYVYMYICMYQYVYMNVCIYLCVCYMCARVSVYVCDCDDMRLRTTVMLI